MPLPAWRTSSRWVPFVCGSASLAHLGTDSARVCPGSEVGRVVATSLVSGTALRHPPERVVSRRTAVGGAGIPLRYDRVAPQIESNQLRPHLRAVVHCSAIANRSSDSFGRNQASDGFLGPGSTVEVTVNPYWRLLPRVNVEVSEHSQVCRDRSVLTVIATVERHPRRPRWTRPRSPSRGGIRRSYNRAFSHPVQQPLGVVRAGARRHALRRIRPD